MPDSKQLARPKLVTGKVTIRPCNIGMGYFYKNACFAYVWAVRPFSRDWWLNLLLVANIHPQDCLKFGATIAEQVWALPRRPAPKGLKLKRREDGFKNVRLPMMDHSAGHAVSPEMRVHGSHNDRFLTCEAHDEEEVPELGWSAEKGKV